MGVCPVDWPRVEVDGSGSPRRSPPRLIIHSEDMSEDGQRDEVEELLLVIEELEDAVILQDEELRLRDNEIEDLHLRVDGLLAELESARSALIEARALPKSNSSEADLLKLKLRERDSELSAMQAENRRLRQLNTDLEGRVETVLLQQRMGTIHVSPPGLAGPEPDLVLRRSLPIEKSIPNSAHLKKRGHPEGIGPMNAAEGSSRRLDSKESIILRHLRASKAAREAWVDSPVRREMRSNREITKMTLPSREEDPEEPQADDASDMAAEDILDELS